MPKFNLFNRASKVADSTRVEPFVAAEINPVTAASNVDLQNIESFADAMGITNSMAGQSVTANSSLKLSIVYTCVRLIAGAIAQMSVHVYEDGNDHRKKAKHPLNSLLNVQPTAIFSAATFWEFIVSCMLLHGDGLAILLRNRNGDVIEILPIQPFDWHNERKDGRLVYYVRIDNKWHGFDQDDVLHLAGFGFNGLRSLSVIKWGAQNAIGLEMAMEEYSSEFFRSGANQSVAIVKSGKWDTEQQEQFRSAYARTYGGNDKRKLPLTIARGMDIKNLSVNAKDSQLLESRDFQITDIARAFGLPSFMVNQEQKSTSWGSGLSEIGTGFVRFTLMPHLNRFEQEINRKLFLNKPYLVEFNTAALMRGTLKERNEAYRQGVGGSQGPGWLTLNEVRRMENLEQLNDPLYDKLYDPRSASLTASETDNENK